MKVVSFNVNGIRARLHQLEQLISDYQPDIIGLQETKVEDALFPEDAVQQLGYHVHYHGQKGHYGVALLSKLPANGITKGFATDTKKSQKRWITGEFSVNGRTLTICNGYFPQGENRSHPEKFPNKAQFYADTLGFLKKHSPSNSLIVMGDLNISHQDIDIGIGEENRKRWLRSGKCSFLPEEREWLEQVMAWGLEDTYRKHFPDDASHFSWFDYRSKGFDDNPKRGLRIDLILATQPLNAVCTAAGIGYDIRGMEKPSDHAPIWADFDI